MSDDRYAGGSTPESGDSGLIERYLYAGTPSDPERMQVNEYGEAGPSGEMSGTVATHSLDDPDAPPAIFAFGEPVSRDEIQRRLREAAERARR